MSIRKDAEIIKGNGYFGVGGTGKSCFMGEIAHLPNQSARIRLRQLLATLLDHYGKQNWWPAETPFQVIIGAILTQNTNWRNVEQAIKNLRAAEGLSVERIKDMPTEVLEELIRPSGYYRQKAKRLKTFAEFVHKRYGNSLPLMFAQETDALRAELLALDGVGKETADSILAFAGQHEVFVVDAYTRRIFERHGIVDKKVKYEVLRAETERMAEGLKPPGAGHAPRHSPSGMSLAARSRRAEVLHELHAGIVRAGNEYCRATPRCARCPLMSLLPMTGPRGLEI